MKLPVFDLHCDTALGLLGKDFYPEKQLRSNSLHIDLDRACQLPGYCQFFACFTTPWEKLPPNLTVEDGLAVLQQGHGLVVGLGFVAHAVTQAGVKDNRLHI